MPFPKNCCRRNVTKFCPNGKCLCVNCQTARKKRKEFKRNPEDKSRAFVGGKVLERVKFPVADRRRGHTHKSIWLFDEDEATPQPIKRIK